MTMKMYSVRDLATNQFNQPFCELADDSAIRGFSYQINNNGIMGFKPCDFQLFQIGEFDLEKGDVVSILPVLICRGEEVYADQ